jgi:hypothetical protein
VESISITAVELEEVATIWRIYVGRLDGRRGDSSIVLIVAYS